MARLSSEHHADRPADNPRRRKGHRRQVSKSPVVGIAATSPSKRAASSAAETSEQSTKRMKRVQVNDHDQLARELEESASRSHNANDTDDAVVEKPRRRRRHSDPAVTTRDEDENVNAATPASRPLHDLAPHLSRLSRPTKTSRRVRMSMPAQLPPTEEENTTRSHEVQFAPLRAIIDKRHQRSLKRSHLSEEINSIDEHKKEDRRRKKELHELRSQLQTKEGQIKELELQVEAQRLGNIDMSEDQTRELQLRLDQAHKEIEELKTSSIYTPTSLGEPLELSGEDFDDDGDNDGGGDGVQPMLIEPEDLISSQEDIDVTPPANGFYVSRALASSQVTSTSLTSLTDYDFLAVTSHDGQIPDRISDQASKRFETELTELKTQLASTESLIRSVTVHLQNLYVLAPGATNDEIIAQLRHVFNNAREEVEALFPKSTHQLNNSELVTIMIEHLKGLLAELKQKVEIAENYSRTVEILRSEVTATFDLLATSEDHVRDLEGQLNGAKASNEHKDHDIGTLNDRIASYEVIHKEQENSLVEKEAQIKGLEHELDDKETDLKRLRDALDKYHHEVRNLTETVTHLEEDHASKVAELQARHTAELQTLQDELEVETEGRVVAEADAAQKSSYIDELEERVEKLGAEVQEITDGTSLLRERYATETAKLETAKAERDSYANVAYEYVNKIENLEEIKTDLETEIAQIRSELEIERKQREENEAVLDARDDEITALNDRIRNASIQANELRTQLFGAQQDKAETISKFKEEAEIRERDLLDELNTEARGHCDAQEQVSELEIKVAGLQGSIESLEDEVAQMIQERDELRLDRDTQVATLSRNHDDLAKKFTAFEATKKNEIDGLQSTIKDLTNDFNAERARCEGLEASAADAARQHVDELTTRNATIAKRDTDIAALRKENEELIDENASLSRRLEHEAVELLNIMSSHAEEANALNRAIATQKETICNMQDALAQAKEEYAAALAEKDQEIEDLQIIDDTRIIQIQELLVERREMVDGFEERLREMHGAFKEVLGNNRRAIEMQERVSEELTKKDEQAREWLKVFKEEGLRVKTDGVSLRKVAHGRVKKVGEKVTVNKKGKAGRVMKRQWDSGIGADERFEVDGEVQAIADDIVVG